MVLKIKLHRRARADLAAIKAYLMREAGARSAERVRTHLNARILRLSRHPNLGITSDEPGIRILSPAKYPYRIYFTVTGDTVIVLHIRHTSLPLPEPGDVEA